MSFTFFIVIQGKVQPLAVLTVPEVNIQAGMHFCYQWPLSPCGPCPGVSSACTDCYQIPIWPTAVLNNVLQADWCSFWILYQPVVLPSDISVGTVKDIETGVSSVPYNEPLLFNCPSRECSPGPLYSRSISLLCRVLTSLLFWWKLVSASCSFLVVNATVTALSDWRALQFILLLYYVQENGTPQG